MKRRNFLRTAGLLALSAAAVPEKAFPLFQKDAALSGKSAAAFPEKPFPFSRKGLAMDFEPYPLELKHVFTVASYSRTATPGVQVRVGYEGLVGYGEASMPPYLGETVDSVVAFLSKVDLSRFSDPCGLEEILAYVDAIGPGNNAAKAAVDIALHDLVGKLLGAPWWKIWGLDKKRAPLTTYTIGIDTPEQMKLKTREVEGRFRMLKVKVGLPGDRENIRAVRQVTSLPLAVDANQGWKDPAFALDMVHWLKEQGVVLVEQPLPKEDIDGMAWLAERSPLPIIADESVKRLDDVRRIAGACHGINIKLMKSTGMREAWKMLNLARALGLKVMVGCMTETSCAVSAAAQLSPAADYADLDGNLLIANDRFRGVLVEDGRLVLNDRPGLGLTRL